MASSAEILIGDSGAQHVLIRPLSRTHPGLFDSHDGNWIDCEVEVVVGGFRGSLRADLRSEEFRNFLDEAQSLVQALESIASFTTMEGQIAISLASDVAGHVRVSGEAIDVAANRLQFAFDIDQTQLQPMCESLEHLLAAFPVMGTPEVEKIEGA